MFIRIGDEQILNTEEATVVGVHLFPPLLKDSKRWRVAVDYKLKGRISEFSVTGGRHQAGGSYGSKREAQKAFDAISTALAATPITDL